MTFIISELSNQWAGSNSVLNATLLQSVMCGADAAKVQLYGDDWNKSRLNSVGKDYLSLSYGLFNQFREMARNYNIIPMASPLD